MATLAAFISSAIEKVSTDPTYTEMDFETREEARVSFTSALLFELGLGPKPEVAKKPAADAPKAEEKPKKKRASKKAQEAVVAEAAVAILEQVKEAPKEVEALTEQMKALTVEEPKAKKARKTKAAEPEPHFGIGAGVPAPAPAPAPAAAPAKEKKKPGPKPKAKPEGAANIEKLTPTHKKHLKAIAEELKVEPRDKEFLVYANEMTAEAWGAKPLDDHIREFLAPEETEPTPVPKAFLQVEFDGTEYLVDPSTCFIYAMSDDGETVKARDHIGVVGMGTFKDMEMPEMEDE
jgi:hypothetical protein